MGVNTFIEVLDVDDEYLYFYSDTMTGQLRESSPLLTRVPLEDSMNYEYGEIVWLDSWPHTMGNGSKVQIIV